LTGIHASMLIATKESLAEDYSINFFSCIIIKYRYCYYRFSRRV